MLYGMVKLSVQLEELTEVREGFILSPETAHNPFELMYVKLKGSRNACITVCVKSALIIGTPMIIESPNW